MAEAKGLFESIRAGDLAAVQVTLAASPALAAARSEAGISAIMSALYMRRADIAEALRAAGPPLDVFEAVALGRMERLEELLAADPALASAWSPDGFTALHYAAFFGTPDAARRLVAAGADVGAAARNAMRVAPLNSAAASHQIATCALLLEHGASPDVRQQEGWTALHEAATSDDRDLLELLLRHGADPVPRNDAGRTPLDLAEEKGHRETADRLRRAASERVSPA